jgi:hypothetical protein
MLGVFYFLVEMVLFLPTRQNKFPGLVVQSVLYYFVDFKCKPHLLWCQLSVVGDDMARPV